MFLLIKNFFFFCINVGELLLILDIVMVVVVVEYN